MHYQILLAALPVVVTVAVHAVGFAVLLRVILRWHALDRSGFRPVTGLVIGMACWLMLIHLAEIAVWGIFYAWQRCMPDVGTGFYFSAVTYTTLGDDALLLPAPWRMLAPLEAMTAVLMCGLSTGLSTGLFFVLVSQWHSNWLKVKTALEPNEVPRAALRGEDDAAHP